jgi:hypothetical protein
MPRLDFDLVGDDGVRRERIAVHIPDDEWAILGRFSGDVERLRATAFVKNRRGSEIRVAWSPEVGARVSTGSIDPDEAGAMLLKCRPFLLKQEEAYFHKIKNLLKRRLPHPAFHKHIEMLADFFSLRAMGQRTSKSKSPQTWGLSRTISRVFP